MGLTASKETAAGFANSLDDMFATSTKLYSIDSAVVNRRVPQNPVNEFYQKGCQEKSSASTGGEMFSRDPAHGS
jgi:hypothetical protein